MTDPINDGGPAYPQYIVDLIKGHWDGRYDAWIAYKVDNAMIAARERRESESRWRTND